MNKTYRMNWVTLLGLLLLAPSSFFLAQTSAPDIASGTAKSLSTSSREYRPDKDRADLARLKRVVKEQHRRIADLENSLKVLQLTVNGNPNLVKATSKPAAKLPRRVPSAWSLIKVGMSRTQVEELLGVPVSVDSVIDSQTLIYQGYISGTGALSGFVKLTDARVTQVNPSALALTGNLNPATSADDLSRSGRDHIWSDGRKNGHASFPFVQIPCDSCWRRWALQMQIENGPCGPGA
jgi:hypothetical protein